MATRQIIVLDAQLLVLLAVGTTSRDLISKHKKTRQFDAEAFDLLISLIGNHPLIFLPNIVTEASNHLCWHSPPERDHINAIFKALVDKFDERYVPSRAACAEVEYLRLGVADVAAILAIDDGILLTADVALYLATLARGLRAVNFNHERERL